MAARFSALQSFTKTRPFGRLLFLFFHFPETTVSVRLNNFPAIPFSMGRLVLKKAESLSEFIDAVRVRASVFIVEQGFAPGWEPDEEDKTAVSYIAVDGKTVVSTLRVNPLPGREFKIERMATLKNFRRKGIGEKLLTYAITETLAKKPKRIWCRSKVDAAGFYERNGFKQVSVPYEMYGQTHIDLEYQV